MNNYMIFHTTHSHWTAQSTISTFPFPYNVQLFLAYLTLPVLKMEAAGSSDYSALHLLLACVLSPQSLWIIILEIKNSWSYKKMICPSERNIMRCHECVTVKHGRLSIKMYNSAGNACH